MGDHLFIPGYYHLADHGFIDKHSIRPVQILFKLYPEAGGEDRVVENTKSQKSKLKVKIKKSKVKIPAAGVLRRALFLLLNFDF